MQYIGDIIRARYLEKFLPKGSGNLLDAGAGAGIYKSLVISKGYRYFGIDIKPRDPSVAYGDLTDIPFPANYFNVAICIDVLEHVQDDVKALKELFRVLKPEGSLFLHTPNSEQTHILAEFQDNPLHVRKGYKKEELERLLKKANFRNIEVYATFNPLECICWEMVNLINQKANINLRKLIEFDLEKYKNLGWICIARKS